LVTTFILASAVIGAAVVPLTASQRVSWFSRLFGKKKVAPSEAVAAPPAIPNDAGWQLITSDNAADFKEWLAHDQAGLPYGPDEELSLGSHLLIELFDCDPDSLKHVSTVGNAMKESAVRSKATVVADSFHEFEPWGVSGAVIIQESHYTIHTWPEHGYAAVDLFYCGGAVHVNKAVDVLNERFKPGRIKFLIVRRGIESEVTRRP